MATVHLGRLLGPVGFSRTVAIKRLHDQFAKDDEFVGMFIDEARLAARIHHPNVVQTLDVVQHESQLLLVMEYVHGVQLSTLTRTARKAGNRMPKPVVIAIVAGMLRGLHAAHEATDEQGKPLNIVHRDVSPHNVLIGGDGVPRVIDFGVAKAAGRIQQTATGQLKGKVPYMAPEQVRGQNVTRRTDLFAAGVVLWETLLGQRLFTAENDAAIISEILGRELEPPSKLDVEVTAAFDAVVMRALDREPSHRFATALEMAEALEKCDRVAAPAEVATWVNNVASEVLAKRASLVSEVESTSGQRAIPKGAFVEPSTNPSASLSIATQPATQRFGLLLGLVALVAMAAIGYFVAREIVYPRTAPSAEPKIFASPQKPSAVASVSVVPAPSSSPSVAPSVAKPVLKPKPKPAPASCDPPYTFDATGMKKYKPECL